MPSPTSELVRLPNTIVRAGAGAGKTTQLVKQVFSVAAEFLTKEKRAPRLLVTTFTKKATQELRERLVKSACEEHPEFLEFVSSASLLHISTIHGLLVLFLRRYGHLAGVDAGFKILDATTAENMQKKIFKEFLLQSADYAKLLEEFSVNDIIGAVSDIDDCLRVHAEGAPYGEAELVENLKIFRQKTYTRGIELLEQIASEATKENWQDFAKKSGHLVRDAVKAQASFGDTIEKWNFFEWPKFSKNVYSADLKDEFDDWYKSFEKYAELPAMDERNLSKAAQTLKLFAALREQMAQTYSARKKTMGLFEMKDLEFLTLEILRSEPSLGAAFARDWDYSLIDEYQDTSPLQVEILKMLLKGVPQYVVGDPQQSIYLFRGARSEVFTDAEKAIVAAHGDRKFLSANYRSRPELLFFINDLSAQLGRDFSAMEPDPRKPERDAKACVAIFAPVDVKADRFLPIAQFISREGGRYDDFAVLARRNSDLLEIAHYLESLGIPTHVHAAGGFTQQREVLDALFVLRFLANPHDYENVIGLMRTPWFRVDDSTLAEWAQQIENRDWFSMCTVAGSHPVIERLQRLLVDTVSLGVFETLRRVVMTSGMIDLSHFHDATGRRESNIWKLLMAVRKAERTPNFNFNAFVSQALAGIASEEDEGEAVAALEPNRINLMTVHKAKGLKFKKVIIPNMQPAPRTLSARAHEKLVVCDEATKKWSVRMPLGSEDKRDHLLPARQTLEAFADRERAETKRLLYVAVTRAEEKCFFTWVNPPEASSWASMLQFSLVPGEHHQEKYSYEVWQGPWAVPALVASTSAVTSVRKKWQTETVEKTSGRISVSTLLDLTTTSVKVIGTTKPAVDSTAKLEHGLRVPYMGTKIHAFLERLRYHPEADFDQQITEWFGDQGAPLRQGLKYVAALKSPPMAELLRSGEVEWGFQTKTKRGVLEGQVDLWGVAQGEIWVIDYKSGSEFFKERAFSQLELYAYAISRGGYDLPVRLAVIYPLAQKVELRHGRPSNVIAKEYNL